MIRFEAAIPPTQSAIRIGGGQGENTRLTLDCYMNGEQITDLLSRYRGRNLIVVIVGVDEVDKGVDDG